MTLQPTNSKCCCCIELRTGVIVIAVLQILGAVGVLGYGIFLGTIAPIVALIGLINLVGLVAGATLLIGGIWYNTTAIILYIVLAVIEIINLGVMTFGVFGVAIFGDSQTVNLFLTLLVVAAGGHIYFTVCVYKFYKEIKSGTIIPA